MTDVTELVAALDDAAVAGSIRVIIAKVGDRDSEAELLRSINRKVADALKES